MYDDNSLDELFDIIDTSQENFIIERELDVSLQRIRQTFKKVNVPFLNDIVTWCNEPDIKYRVIFVPQTGILHRQSWEDQEFYYFSIDVSIQWIDVSEEDLKKYMLPEKYHRYYTDVSNEDGPTFFMSHISGNDIDWLTDD